MPYNTDNQRTNRDIPQLDEFVRQYLLLTIVEVYMPPRGIGAERCHWTLGGADAPTAILAYAGWPLGKTRYMKSERRRGYLAPCLISRECRYLEQRRGTEGSPRGQDRHRHTIHQWQEHNSVPKRLKPIWH